MILSAGSDAIYADWDYAPSLVPWRLRLSRLVRSATLRRPAPAHRVLYAAMPAQRWSVYFMYLADGEMTAAHRYTLDRLAAEPGRLLVVCAAATSDAVPAEIAERCDALIWKALPGFDFSAYGIALRHLAAVSPGCDAFVMNDSVLGPFASPAAALADAPWDLAGFTGSWLFENHIQSYAFQLREVTPGRVAALAPVLSRRTAFNRYMDVVICQETRLARVAARTMRVGARFFVADRVAHNPSLHHAAMLARAGVPFIKRSLLTHYAAFQDRTEIAAIVAGHGHPLPEGA